MDTEKSRQLNRFECEELGGLVLPLPVPVPCAIEAGVFGFEVEGLVIPDVSQVRALTVEHTRNLLHAWEALTYLTDCAQRGLSPTTGRPITGGGNLDTIHKVMNKEAEQLWDYYCAMLDEYASAFGFDAAEMLHQSVSAAFELQVLIPLPRPIVAIQKVLF